MPKNKSVDGEEGGRRKEAGKETHQVWLFLQVNIPICHLLEPRRGF